MTFVGGYTVFLPGMWNIPNFLFSYLMIIVFPVILLVWKLVKKNKWRKPEEVDLLMGKAEIDAYEAEYVEPPPRYASPPLIYTCERDVCPGKGGGYRVRILI